MKRKISLSAALVLILIAVLLTFLITNSVITGQFSEKLTELDAGQVEYQKLAAIESIVRENYAGELDSTALSENSIAGFVRGLGDPECRYLTAEEYAQYLLEKDEKPVYGLGFCAAYNSGTGLARISYVESSSEAALVGVQAGDTLLSVGGRSVSEQGFEAVSELFTGPAGESTSITVGRGEESATYTLKYALVSHDRVSGSLALGQTALISIRSFEEETHTDLKAVIDRLISSGADSLVFDVRGVQSREFDAAIECVKVVAGLKDLARLQTAGGAVEVISGDGAGVPLDCAVLVDEYTSGAPELFAASMRDAAGAVIAGKTTAGCASLAADIRLNDMSALILTTKVYLPPVSDSFAGVGVKPDHEWENSVDFASLAPKDDVVLSETYYLWKPEKRDQPEEEIIVPEDPGDGPVLIETE